MIGENSKRRKRSLGPLKYIGKLHRFLYGSLDEDDKEFFDRQIDNLANSTSSTLTLIGNQTQIVKNKFLKVDKIIANLTEQVNKNIVVIRQNFLEWNESYMAFEKLSTIQTYVSLLNRYLTDLELDTELLINAIIFAKEGQIHPKLFNHDSISELKQIIGSHFKDVSFPISSDNPTITDLANLCEIVVYTSSKKLSYILNIPLVSIEKFTLYEHFSIPVRQHLSQIYASIEPRSKFVALSWDTEKYFLISERQLNTCKRNEQNYICESLPVHRMDENTPCEIKLIVNRYEKSSNFQNCDIRIKNLVHDEFEKLYKKNAWLYSLVKTHPMTIICNQKDKYNIILHSSGVIQLQPGCIAKSDKITLTPVEKISSYTSTDFYTKSLVNLSQLIARRCDSTETSYSEILNLTAPEKIIDGAGDSLNNIIMKAKNLKKHVEMSREIISMKNSYNLFALLTLLTIILIIISFLLIKFKIHILCSRCYVKNNSPTTNNRNVEHLQLEVISNPQMIPNYAPSLANTYQNRNIILAPDLNGNLSLSRVKENRICPKYVKSKESRNKRIRIS